MKKLLIERDEEQKQHLIEKDQIKRQLQVKVQELKLEVDKPLSIKAVEAALKTMRRTGYYGLNSGDNIEWPTASDLLQMAQNIPVKIQVLKYQRSTYSEGKHFGAFQVILSNGMSSPVFNATNTNDQGMQWVNIPDYSLVKRVNGT